MLEENIDLLIPKYIMTENLQTNQIFDSMFLMCYLP